VVTVLVAPVFDQGKGRPPESRAIRFARARVEHSAERGLDSPFFVEVAVAFAAFSRLGTRQCPSLRGRSPWPTRSRLRIAGRVAAAFR
jgi:hypothetical protein